MFCGTMVYAVCKMQWNNLLNIVEYLKTSWFSARAEWTEGTNRSKCKSVNMHKYAFSFLLYTLLRKKKKKKTQRNQGWITCFFGETAKQLVLVRPKLQLSLAISGPWGPLCQGFAPGGSIGQWDSYSWVSLFGTRQSDTQTVKMCCMFPVVFLYQTGSEDEQDSGIEVDKDWNRVMKWV